MPFTDIGQADSTSLSTVQQDYSVTSMQTDAPTTGEYTWYFNNFTQYLGYYKKIPELRAAIDCIATWTVGKGFIADAFNEAQLVFIKGFGKDTFNSILENMIRTMYINGDSFAEIIKDVDGTFINLKPLDPSSIVIVAEKGVIKRYEQITKIKGQKNKIFQVDDLFHLSRNRVADEVHGVSMIEALEPMILARNEAMEDMRKLMHRHVKPMRVWHVDTDDTTKIAGFKTMIDDATNKSENTIIPKGTVQHELVSVPQGATLSPLGWINLLRQEIFKVARVPEIIVGGSNELTEASAKISYLAFQQTIEEEQLYIEEQVRNQLFVFINLEFPASLERDLLSDKRKDQGSIGFAAADTTAGVGQ